MKGRIAALVAATAAAAGAAGAALVAKRRKPGQLDLEVPAGAVVPAPLPRTAPVAEPAAPSPDAEGTTEAAPVGHGGPDDLTAIRGLGKVKAARLIEAGITSYAQIAAWTDDDIAEVGLKVNTSPGQIKREDWVGQARALVDG